MPATTTHRAHEQDLREVVVRGKPLQGRHLRHEEDGGEQPQTDRGDGCVPVTAARISRSVAGGTEPHVPG